MSEQINKAIREHTAPSFNQPDPGLAANVALHPLAGLRREYLKALDTKLAALLKAVAGIIVGVRERVIVVGFFKIGIQKDPLHRYSPCKVEHMESRRGREAPWGSKATSASA
jgi:hypothetical protein